MKGWPTTVLLRGEVLMEDNKLRAKPGSGQFLARKAGHAAEPLGRATLEFDPKRNFGAKLLSRLPGARDMSMMQLRVSGPWQSLRLAWRTFNSPEVSKTWGGAAAVDDVSFSAPAGHLVALLGPSGCGKSTTLRLIAGLETASAGTIMIADREVTALPPAKRGVSMVFQNYALFPHLSVAENILFGLKVRDVPKAGAHRAAQPRRRHSRSRSAARAQTLAALRRAAAARRARPRDRGRDPRLPDG